MALACILPAVAFLLLGLLSHWFYFMCWWSHKSSNSGIKSTNNAWLTFSSDPHMVLRKQAILSLLVSNNPKLRGFQPFQQGDSFPWPQRQRSILPAGSLVLQIARLQSKSVHNPPTLGHAWWDLWVGPWRRSLLWGEENKPSIGADLSSLPPHLSFLSFLFFLFLFHFFFYKLGGKIFRGMILAPRYLI